MLFRDRVHAAGLLCERLAPYRGTRPLVAGLPRGGVLMGREIAEALEGELDILLVRKLRAPDRREFAVGAVEERGAWALARQPFARRIPERYMDEERREALAALRAQRAAYTPGRRALDPAERVVIVVDDGVAASPPMEAGLRGLREAGASRLILATAVAPPGPLDVLRAWADETVCLACPGYFGSASRFFMDFPDVAEEDVVDALRTRAAR
jgi:putative phosphoribosyl transferase